RQPALDAPAVPGDHALDPARALERRHRIVQDHLDAVIAVQALDDTADLLAERAVERRLERLDRDDLEARLRERRRGLGADEAHAHDHRAAPPPDRLADARGAGD